MPFYFTLKSLANKQQLLFFFIGTLRDRNFNTTLFYNVPLGNCPLTTMHCDTDLTLSTVTLT